jgi:GTP-binding protein
MTRAHPKVAGYPFTTLEPVLGTLERGERQLVIADIPGLIEGASAGSGLGHEFLAHVERTRLLIHVLDLAPLDGSDSVANHETVERELQLHDPHLAALPRILALSKADLVEPEASAAARREWSRRLGPEVPVIVTSSVTGLGLDDLARTLMGTIPVAGPDEEAVGQAQAVLAADGTHGIAEHRVYRPATGRGYRVERLGPHSWRVTGAGIERLLARYDLDNDDALAHLERRLRSIGVIRALEAQGFEAGDDVEIAGVEFELDPGR